MKGKRSIFTIIFLILVAAGFLLLRGNNANFPSSSPGSTGVTSTISGPFRKGEKAPDFESVDFDGNPVKLSDFQGKVVVLDFWAAWCPFCIEELPDLEQVHQETIDEVVFLGIHRTDTESFERGRGFAQDKGVTYTLVQDASGDIYNQASQGLNAMPTAVFIGKDGVVRDIKLGPKTKEEIREKVGRLLEASN